MSRCWSSARFTKCMDDLLTLVTRNGNALSFGSRHQPAAPRVETLYSPCWKICCRSGCGVTSSAARGSDCQSAAPLHSCLHRPFVVSHRPFVGPVRASSARCSPLPRMLVNRSADTGWTLSRREQECRCRCSLLVAACGDPPAGARTEGSCTPGMWRLLATSRRRLGTRTPRSVGSRPHPRSAGRSRYSSLHL